MCCVGLWVPHGPVPLWTLQPFPTWVASKWTSKMHFNLECRITTVSLKLPNAWCSSPFFHLAAFSSAPDSGYRKCRHSGFAFISYMFVVSQQRDPVNGVAQREHRRCGSWRWGELGGRCPWAGAGTAGTAPRGGAGTTLGCLLLPGRQLLRASCDE